MSNGSGVASRPGHTLPVGADPNSEDGFVQWVNSIHPDTYGWVHRYRHNLVKRSGKSQVSACWHEISHGALIHCLLTQNMADLTLFPGCPLNSNLVKAYYEVSLQNHQFDIIATPPSQNDVAWISSAMAAAAASAGG